MMLLGALLGCFCRKQKLMPKEPDIPWMQFSSFTGNVYTASFLANRFHS